MPINFLAWPAAWSLLLLMLVSCAHPPAREAAVDLAVPSGWASGQPGPGVPGGRWWEGFGDTNLTTLVDEALVANHDLQAAAARVEAALAQARVAGAGQYPRVGLTADAMRDQRNFIGFPIPGTGEEVLTTRSTTYGLGLSASWELDVWGRIRAGRKAAGGEALAAEADWVGAKHSLAARVVKAWAGLVEAEEQLALARRTAASYRRTAERMRSRYEAGLRPPFELRLALSSASSAEAALEGREAAVKSARHQLEILVGRYPDGSLAAGEGESMPGPGGPVPAGLPLDLLARRPDLVAARRRLEAADWRVVESRAALLPRISLTAAGGTSTEALSDLLDPDYKVWNLAANLAQPLFEGGRLRAGVDVTKARTREALALYQAAALRAFGEVETALAAEGHWARREEELGRAVEQYEAAERLSRLRYETGLDPFITYLEVQRRLLEAEVQWVSARRARVDNRVDLHLALGGGFEMAHETIP